MSQKCGSLPSTYKEGPLSISRMSQKRYRHIINFLIFDGGHNLIRDGKELQYLRPDYKVESFWTELVGIVKTDKTLSRSICKKQSTSVSLSTTTVVRESVLCIRVSDCTLVLRNSKFKIKENIRSKFDRVRNLTPLK